MVASFRSGRHVTRVPRGVLRSLVSLTTIEAEMTFENIAMFYMPHRIYAVRMAENLIMKPAGFWAVKEEPKQSVVVSDFPIFLAQMH